MEIIIRKSDDNLERLLNLVEQIGKGKGRVAISRAVNRTVRSAQSRVTKAVAQQVGMPIDVVKGTVGRKLSSRKGDGPISGELYSKGKPVSLKYYDAKQLPWGVRAFAWGREWDYPGAFIFAGTPNSGKLVGSGHVFKRIGSSSNPIRRIDGPSISDAIVEGEAAHVFASTVESMLPKRIIHELGRLLG